MDDLISRKAVLDELSKYKDRVSYLYPIMYQDVCADIESLPSTDAVPQWIPCEERLPDIKEHHVSDACIVCCKNDAYGFAVLEENIFGQVGWDCERDDEYHTPLGKVVAWMPLPKPYERKES